jgi:hypothetical protein
MKLAPGLHSHSTDAAISSAESGDQPVSHKCCLGVRAASGSVSAPQRRGEPVEERLQRVGSAGGPLVNLVHDACSADHSHIANAQPGGVMAVAVADADRVEHVSDQLERSTRASHSPRRARRSSGCS